MILGGSRDGRDQEPPLGGGLDGGGLDGGGDDGAEGAGADGAGADGAGADGAGVDGAAGAGVLLPPLSPLGAFSFVSLGAGSEPDGENEVTSVLAATSTGVTADGAAAFSLPPPEALPMANAAPNARTTAATAMAAKRPWLIGRGTIPRA